MLKILLGIFYIASVLFACLGFTSVLVEATYLFCSEHPWPKFNPTKKWAWISYVMLVLMVIIPIFNLAIGLMCQVANHDIAKRVAEGLRDDLILDGGEAGDEE